jgi:hypothetical protein
LCELYDKMEYIEWRNGMKKKWLLLFLILSLLD